MKFHENSSSGSRQTNEQPETSKSTRRDMTLIAAFHNLVKAPKNATYKSVHNF